MGDVGDVFKDYKAQQREKKQNNLKSSTNILTIKNINFESKNDGIHLIVQGEDGLIDFWPSTGKFKTRNGITGRGVFNLIKHCKKGENNE